LKDPHAAAMWDFNPDLKTKHQVQGSKYY